MLLVDDEDAGQRLDNFLMRHLKGVPKTHVYRIIRSGEVRVNKGRASADRRIVAGDQIRLPPVRTSERASAKAQVMDEMAAGTGFAPAREFPVLFEDDGLLVQARLLELVHRLDRETSGILLVAKKRSVLKNLQEQFRARETGKTYLAMVSGLWPARLKVLDKSLHKYLLPDGERRVKVVAHDHPQAMPSLSLVKVARQNSAYSLLEVTIKTGRTHQIRTHLAAEGMAIVGDDKYGDFALNKSLQRAGAEVPLRRMFLHAWRLQFRHPTTGETMKLQAELPVELSLFLAHVLPDVH